VLCSRQAKSGALIRLKNDFYVPAERWPYLDRQDFFIIANFLQVPSYISCTTALAYHGLTTQASRRWYESVALKRSVRYGAGDATFPYFKLKKEFYFGFTKIGPFFMAEKEKAFLDACHLSAYGCYAIDLSALDIERLDKVSVESVMTPFPERTRNLARKICRI
jgi:predicted transcriptional regulator of viral defense system